MPRIVRFEDDGDFVFLHDMLERIKQKASSSDSRFFEDALTVERILLNMKAAEHVAAEEEPPSPKASKSPKPKKTKAAPIAIQHGCTEHPGYGAIRPPRTTCEGCWNAFKAYNPDKYLLARRKFDYQRNRQATS